MGLSLETIHKPVNEFFLKQFETSSESPVFFKFDKFGAVMSESDFTDTVNPQNTALAQETFSDLVNRVPVADADGVSVVFLSSSLDEIYNTLLLKGSIPFVKDEAQKEEISSMVASIKSEATLKFEKSSLARSRGAVDDYRASVPTPEKWYDKNTAEIWNKHSFSASESTSVETSHDPKFQLWKLKADVSVLETVIAVKPTEPVKPLELHQRLVMMSSRPFAAAVAPAVVATPAATIKPAVRTRRRIAIAAATPSAAMSASVATAAPSAAVAASVDTIALQMSFKKNLFALDMRKRLIVDRFVKEQAPTQPSATSSISVEFEYCVVNIRRPWMSDSFLRNPNWYLPGAARGKLTAPESDVNIGLLPVAFVAIKNLKITSAWSETDIKNAGNATDFGPFEVSSGMINNQLSHEGIQIIGWLLQKMPDLPPNDPPQ